MISILRVDERLLHGQVATAWTHTLQIDAIILANNEVEKDELRKRLIRIAKPSSVKLAILNLKNAAALIAKHSRSNFKVMVLVGSIEDAKYLVENSEGIKEVNLGHISFKEGKKALSQTVFVDEGEIEDLKYIASKGVQIDARQLPSEKVKNVFDQLK